jgi:hypothetical protein
MKQGVFIHMELADSLREKNMALLNAITTLDLLSESDPDALQIRPPK